MCTSLTWDAEHYGCKVGGGANLPCAGGRSKMDCCLILQFHTCGSHTRGPLHSVQKRGITAMLMGGLLFTASRPSQTSIYPLCFKRRALGMFRQGALRLESSEDYCMRLVVALWFRSPAVFTPSPFSAEMRETHPCLHSCHVHHIVLEAKGLTKGLHCMNSLLPHRIAMKDTAKGGRRRVPGRHSIRSKEAKESTPRVHERVILSCTELPKTPRYGDRLIYEHRA